MNDGALSLPWGPSPGEKDERPVHGMGVNPSRAVKWWGYRSYIMEEGAVCELERSDRRLGQERMKEWREGEGKGRKGQKP